MGIASLILGIISIIIDIATVGVYGWLGAILGIVGIILGVLGRKNAEKKGLATGGMVCSIIGTVLGLVLFIACVAVLGAATAAM